MSYNKLVNGKSDLEGIVALEPRDSDVELFIQDYEGNITSKIVPMKSWLLCDKKLNKNFVQLKGNLHYKFGEQFASREEAKKWGYIYSKKNNEDIYRVYNAKESIMLKDGYTYYKGLEPKDLSVLSFDIETTGLNEHADDAFVICISVTYRDKKGTQKFFWKYTQFETQGGMINDFCNMIQILNPSIILGHNIIQYDFVYLDTAAKRAGTTLKLGRDGSDLTWDHPNSKKRFRVDGNRTLEFQNCSIYGREVVDTYFLAQAFDVSRNMESYGLKPMIKQLGLEKEGRAFYDASQIRFNYKDPVEFEKIIAYCKDDSDDPILLWDRFGPLFFHMAPMIPKSFQEIILGASGSKLNALMVRAYLQDGHSIPKATDVEKYAGAISFAIPGIYSNAFKIDLAALYPSIMIEFDVFDDTKDPNGYLLELVKTFRAKRLEYKALAKETGLQSWSDMDNAAKSILNSFYGFLGAPGLQFNSLPAVSFIAAKGVEILKYTMEFFSGIPFDKFTEMHPQSFEKIMEDSNDGLDES